MVAILNKNCATCHTGARAKGKPPYQLFASQGVLNSSVAADRLLEVLESGKMPPRGRPRLQAEEVAALQKWAQSKN